MRALPAYPGGKRRLLPAIFGLIAEALPPDTWSTSTLCDPFMGGGAVALQAKALGFARVVAGDVAERSAVVGRALVANSSTRLSRELALRLFEPLRDQPGDVSSLVELVRPPLRDLLVSSWVRLRDGTFADVERDLVALLVLKMLIRAFPLGDAGASDAPHVRDGDFDRLTAPRLRHYLQTQQLATPRAVLKLAADVNAGVMPGNGLAVCGDATDLVAGTNADCVYLDPPYPGTQRYESVFALVDEFLGAEPLPLSPYSSTSPPLDDLLDACRDVPVLVLSLNNELLSVEDVSALVSRHRRVRRVVSVPYRHLGAVASRAKSARNREVLVLAEK